MSILSNSQDFDAERFDESLRQSDLLTHLEQKYQDKPYHEENGWWYVSAQWASYVFQIINIASGFAKPFAYLSGIFAFGAIGGIFAFAIAAFFVIGIEWAARKNLIQLFEKRYFKKRTNSSRVWAQVVLNGAIIALSYWGASDAVKIMSGEFQASQPALENEDQIRTHYNLLITSAQKDADAFFAASNWKGKLSPANQRRYNEKLEQKARFTEQMNQAINIAADRNRAAIQSAKDSDQLAMMEKEAKDNQNGEVLAFVAVLSCLLFTLCIALKEYYEYRTAMELTRAGAMKNPRFSQMIREAEKNISDASIRKEFSGNGSVRNQTEEKPSAQIRWPNYGKTPTPTAILTPQPLFSDSTENGVSHQSQSVTHQNTANAGNGADDAFKLTEKEIRGWAANFNSSKHKDSTVSANINSRLDDLLSKMRQEGFVPSREAYLKFYNYTAGTLFPMLNVKGWPYERQAIFERWLLHIGSATAQLV